MSKEKNTYLIEKHEGVREIVNLEEAIGENTSRKRIQFVDTSIIKTGRIHSKHRYITSPNIAADLGKVLLNGADREKCYVVALNNKNEPTSIYLASIGGINQAVVSPVVVYRFAMLTMSVGILIYHNHPSGDPEPSKEDISITKRLQEAGKILGITLTDHIILGDDTYVSLKERGIISC